MGNLCHKKDALYWAAFCLPIHVWRPLVHKNVFSYRYSSICLNRNRSESSTLCSIGSPYVKNHICTRFPRHSVSVYKDIFLNTTTVIHRSKVIEFGWYEPDSARLSVRGVWFLAKLNCSTTKFLAWYWHHIFTIARVGIKAANILIEQRAVKQSS